jgi:hypothetical protein
MKNLALVHVLKKEVCNVFEWNENTLPDHGHLYSVVDITNTSPVPCVGDLYENGVFSHPQNQV